MSENSYKYTLIISQYSYSRHFFIIKHDENFIENAKKFATELVLHKRDKESTREIYIGDLTRASKEIRPRYNINDQGDIYFLQSNYTNYLMNESWSYKDDTRREARGFQKKQLTEDINQHHSYNDVKRIVIKYFEIT